MSYQPMHPAEKPVSREKMLDILAKRTNSPLSAAPQELAAAEQPLDGAERPLAALSGLQWAKPIWYEPGVVGCVISICGRYRVDKCGASYTPWRKAQSRDHLNLRLGEVESLKAAQRLCQADLDCGADAGQLNRNG